jgi:hypothetical protein
MKKKQFHQTVYFISHLQINVCFALSHSTITHYMHSNDVEIILYIAMKTRQIMQLHTCKECFGCQRIF